MLLSINSPLSKLYVIQLSVVWIIFQCLVFILLKIVHIILLIDKGNDLYIGKKTFINNLIFENFEKHK